jgi:hypothetical protein
VRLKRDLPTKQLLKVLETNDQERAKSLLEMLGGIQAVEPGKRWEMTEKLTAGTYLALDYGSGAPRVKRFRVLPGHAGAAPAPIGRIAMSDFALSPG